MMYLFKCILTMSFNKCIHRCNQTHNQDIEHVPWILSQSIPWTHQLTATMTCFLSLLVNLSIFNEYLLSRYYVLDIDVGTGIW